ncbi:MAG: prepilin-type N-terminal cleavage/methylation domain-containing protein, partial [Candidatus Absconditabacteria bacterium]
MSKKLQKFLKSFTLIELIIVIAIISVLGASAFLMLSQWMSKSRDSRK